jgi:hypothetical protein
LKSDPLNQNQTLELEVNQQLINGFKLDYLKPRLLKTRTGSDFKNWNWNWDWNLISRTGTGTGTGT